MALVSVVMPVYNVEKYLHSAVKSVLDQTFVDFELILIDDGSPDNCPEICDQYASIDDRIRALHKQNGGLSSARNMGIEASNGKYLLFLDSDDDIETNLLENVVKEAEDAKAQLTIFGYTIKIIDNTKLLSQRNIKSYKTVFRNHLEIEAHFVELSEKGLFNFAWGKLYLRSTVIDNQLKFNSIYDKTCEDTVFLLELFPYIERICVIDEIYHNYYIRKNQSITSKFVSYRYLQFYGKFKILSKLMNSFSVENQDDDYLYLEYAKYILWAYEFMFHEGCRSSYFERYEYLKQTFSIRQESKEYCTKVIYLIKKNNLFADYSRTARKALICILRGDYIGAWLWQLSSLVILDFFRKR